MDYRKQDKIAMLPGRKEVKKGREAEIGRGAYHGAYVCVCVHHTTRVEGVVLSTVRTYIRGIVLYRGDVCFGEGKYQACV